MILGAVLLIFMLIVETLLYIIKIMKDERL